MKNSMEVYQNLTPEYEGDACPMIQIDHDSVALLGDAGERVSLTRAQFDEAIRYYDLFKKAEEVMKDVQRAEGKRVETTVS